MNHEPDPSPEPLRRADLLRILSPLLFFVAHVIYLVGWSADPFLKKWLDGSFTFFVALVFCNIIRSRVVARSQAPEDEEDEEDEGGAHPDDEAGRDRRG